MDKRSATTHTDIYTGKQQDNPNEPIKHPDDNQYRKVDKN